MVRRSFSGVLKGLGAVSALCAVAVALTLPSRHTDADPPRRASVYTATLSASAKAPDPVAIDTQAVPVSSGPPIVDAEDRRIEVPPVSGAGPDVGGLAAERESRFRGAGLVNAPATCGDVDALAASWYYTWWHDPVCDATSAEFVPMLWTDWCRDGRECAALPSQLEARGASVLLGFNEPDSREQADLPVSVAVDRWAVLSATGLRLVSPAVQNTVTGRAWLSSFMASVHERGLRVDAIAVHWYGACNVPDLMATLDVYAGYGRPLWLTEWSCRHADEEANARFVEAALPALRARGDVERVAWFVNRPYAGGWERSALVDSSGALTSVGAAYAAG